MAAACMQCVVGSCAGGEDPESRQRGRPPSPGPRGEPEAIGRQPCARADLLGVPHAAPGSVSPEGAPRWPEGTRRPPGALQREMNALFIQKLEEIRSKSPMFSTDPRPFSMQRSVSSLCSLETIAEEPAPGPGPLPQPAAPPRPAQWGPWCTTGPAPEAEHHPGLPLRLRTGSQGDTEPAPHGRRQAGPGGAWEGAPGSQTDSRGHARAPDPVPSVRRAKSQWQVLSEALGGRRSLAGPATALHSDATGGDWLWQRPDPGSLRDSVSSSSSLSSGDTAVDLALPGGPGLGRDSLLGALARRRPLRPRSAPAARLDFLSAAKSQSHPNLRAAGQLPGAPDALRPRPHAPRGGLPPSGLGDGPPTSAKSKSLGDLTADDFAPRLPGPRRPLDPGLGPAGGEGPGGQAARGDPLMEQLLWLTGFQQAGDITSPTSLGQAGEGAAGGPGFRRRSSRSQSRVRAIASRARRAQERRQRDPGGLPEEEWRALEGVGGDVPAPKGAASLLLRL